MVYISLSMQYIVIVQNMHIEIFYGFWIDVLTLLEKKTTTPFVPNYPMPWLGEF